MPWTFAPVPLAAPAEDGDNHIKLRGMDATIKNVWPAAAARDCAAWLGSATSWQGYGLVRCTQREDFHVVFELVMANQADIAVETSRRALGVSVSGFCAWRDRAPSRRLIDDAVMTERMRAIHEHSKESYGMPRVGACWCWVQQEARRATDAQGEEPRHQPASGFTVTTRRNLGRDQHPTW